MHVTIMFLMFKIHLIWTHASLEHLFPNSFYWNNSIAFHLTIFFLVVEINSHIMLSCLYLIWNMKYPTAVMTVGLYLHNYCGLNKKKICLLSLFTFSHDPWFQKAVGSSWRKSVTVGWPRGLRASLNIIFSLSDC